jgi:aminoglycoside phosphotransferase (APT) family kinase protein
MREPALLSRVARALRAFHDGAPIPGSFDSFRIVECYRRTAIDRGGSVPDAYDWANEVARRIEATRSTDAPVPCHNDLLNANFLDDWERLRIVDWEYAGMGDRFFDLANTGNHEPTGAASCCSYFGVARVHMPSNSALHVRHPRGACGRRVRPRIGTDCDFDAYAAEHSPGSAHRGLAGVRRALG